VDSFNRRSDRGRCAPDGGVVLQGRTSVACSSVRNA